MKVTEFQKIAQMIAKEHKIKIEEGPGWAADIKQRQVFYRKDDIYTLPEEHILGLTLHEIAHIHYTTPTELPKKNKELLHATMNMLEDISIEHIISKDYPNAGEILSSTKTEVLDTLIRMLPTYETSKFEKSLLYAAARFEERGYEIPREEYEKTGETISKIMKKAKDQILNRNKTGELLPIATQIVNLIIKDLGEPDEEEKRKLIQQGGANNEGNTNETGIKRDVIDELKDRDGWGKNLENATDDIHIIDEIIDQARTIGKKIRAVLKRNNAMEFGGRYRTGKLLTKRFVRVKTVKDRRPFARRIIKSNQSYAFALASDISGSMGAYGRTNSPKDYALNSMYMVGEALRIAGVARSLIVFADHAVPVAPMSKKEIMWNQIADYSKLNKAGGGTEISEAIRACTKELKNTRAERKIMVILTDGSSDLDNMLKAHKEATNLGIECLGITLDGDHQYMNETFSEKKNTVIKEIRDTKLIGKAFIDILKSSIAASPQ